MNAFKKKSLYLAVVAGLGSVGMAGTASAVNINTNGTGQVLIFPYYTVRADLTTAFSVVNTTASAKAVKVRFTEGKNSREVLDFNLYLSPNDVWTGAVVATAAGAKLITHDHSCTFPNIPKVGGNLPSDAGVTAATEGTNFVNYAYSGTAGTSGTIAITGSDGAGTSLDRTREGYFEMIEMGVITDAAVAAAVTHNTAGFPANCAVVQSSAMTMFAGGTNPVVAPTGGLAGTASLVNVGLGTDFGYDPVALAAFSTNNIWNLAGSISPDMRDAFPVVSRVFKGGTTVVTDWAGSVGDDAVNAVSAVLMHDKIMNEFIVDQSMLSGTDWVITMPTKRHYVPVTSGTAVAPFTKFFAGTSGACEPMTVDYWNREESATAVSDFSPPIPGSGSGSACLPWESTVVTFNATVTSPAVVSNVLASTNSANIGVSPEIHGWAKLTFAQSYASAVGAPSSLPVGVHTYIGLPTVGFMVQKFTNTNAAPGVMATYGGNFNHKFTTSIAVPGGVPAVGAE